MNKRTIGVALTADPSGMQAGLSSATSAAQQFAARTTASLGKVSAASASMHTAGSNVSKGINDMTLAERAHSAAAQRFVADLERQVAAIGKTRVELLQMQAVQMGVSTQAAPLISALNSSATSTNQYSKSTKEMAFAMRGVPAQITDIFVSLQSGQRPMMVMLQQGGQLKDMFGGIVPAARALSTTLLGMINPYTLAAGAAVGLYAAYRTGAGESETFNKTLVMTGNVAGVTVSQLNTMAERVGDLVGTQHQAAAALNELAGSANIAARQFEAYASAAIVWEQATGTAVAKTVEQFEELGKAPVEASLKLNQSMNHLTVSTYQQISALVGAGRHTEAAAVAQNAYADAIKNRSPEIIENLNLWQRMWKEMKEDIQEVASLMGSIGRPETPQIRLDQLQNEYDRISGSPAHTERAAAIQAQIVGLRDLIKWQDAVAQNRGSEARAVAEIAAADQKWAKIVEGNLTKRQQMERDIADIRKNGIILGKSEVDIEAQIAAYQAKNADKKSGGISSSQTELANLKAKLEAERQRELALHSLSAAQATLNEGEKLALQYAEKIKLATDAKTVAQLKAAKAMAEEYGARKRANDEYDRDVKASESRIDSIRKQTQTIQDQVDTYGMGRSAIEAMTIARLEEKLAIDSLLTGDDRHLELLRKEIEERKNLLDAMRTKEGLDEQLKEWKSWERQVDQIFGRVGQSLTDKIFEGGVSARDLLKDVFKGLTFNVAINPMMQGMQGWVTNQLGGMMGYQNPAQQQGGGMGNIGSMFNFGGSMAGTAQSAGAWLSSSGMAPDLGANLIMNADKIGDFASVAGDVLGYGKAIFDITQGKYGSAAGTAIGTALGGPVGAAIGGMLGGFVDDAFDGPPKTRHGQRTTVDYADGAFGISQRDDRQAPGSDAAAKAFAEASVQAANSLFAKVGVDAAIESFYAVMESSVLGDRNGVASGGALRVGEDRSNFGVRQSSDMTLAGFGGWSSEDMFSRLQTDILLSTMEAFQKVGDQLPTVLSDMVSGVDFRNIDPATAQDYATRFSAVVEGASAFMVSIEALPFENLKALSFNAAAGLIAAAGGLENLNAGLTSYYQNFYTQEEQLALSAKNIEAALTGVGLAMPDVTQGAETAKAAFRSMFEAIDPATEWGATAAATMLGVNESFAQLVTGLEELNGAVGAVGRTVRSAADIAQERLSLETQLLQLQGNVIEIRRRELEALDESNHALQRRIWALRDQADAWNAAVAGGESAYSALARSVSAEKARLQKESQAIADALRGSITGASAAVNELTGLTGRLQSTLRSMTTSLPDESRTFAWAQDRVDRALSVAKLTGVMPQGEDFETALQIVAKPSEGLYDSFEAYQLDFLKTAHTVNSLNDLADGQLTTEKRALRALEDQLSQSQDWYQAEMARLDEMLEMERQRLDIAMGTYETVLTIPEALAGIAAEIGNIRLTPNPAVPGGGGGGYTPVPGSDIGSSSWTTDYLYKNEDVLKAYDASWGLSPEAWAAYHYETYGQYEGRSFDVGTNYVPYNMKANIHEGERIIPKADNRALMHALNSAGDQSNVIRLLQQEIRELRLMTERKLDEGNRNTSGIDRTNRQMVEQPQQVEVTNIVRNVAVTPGT